MTSELKSLLSDDENYARFLRIRDTAMSAINIPDLLKEAEFLHANRKSRTLSSAKMSPNAVQAALVNDMANRSRLVELRAALMKTNELLSTALLGIRRHIRVSYKDALKDMASTQADRNHVLDKILGKSVKYKAQLDHAEDLIDLYIKDVDQTAFGLRNAVEILKLFLDRRSTEI